MGTRSLLRLSPRLELALPGATGLLVDFSSTDHTAAILLPCHSALAQLTAIEALRELAENLKPFHSHFAARIYAPRSKKRKITKLKGQEGTGTIEVRERLSFRTCARQYRVRWSHFFGNASRTPAAAAVCRSCILEEASRSLTCVESFSLTSLANNLPICRSAGL